MFANLLTKLRRATGGSATEKDFASEPNGALDEILRQARAVQPPPVVWLLGKTQSGKTSIIRSLTGSQDAVIGNGFQSCTRTARFYDHPAEAPVVRFLDTQGLGEVDYDPTEDLAFCEAQAQLIIAVIKVSDTLQSTVFDVLRAVRRRRPDWPIIVAQTCLHECYPADFEHILPYPFGEPGWEGRAPSDLTRALLFQRNQLGPLPGMGPVFWIPVDLTLSEDNLRPEDYGLDALWTAIQQASQVDLDKRLRDETGRAGRADQFTPFSQAVHQQIVGYTLASAALGAIPLVDLAALPALQMKMLRTLGDMANVHWDKQRIADFSALLGPGIITGYGLRLAGRSAIKLIPVLGQTGGAAYGAASGAALTFALGKAACLYLEHVAQGRPLTAEDLRKAFTEALHRGRELIRTIRQKSGS
ncbi:YcjF family protein [Desulfobulbus alkaliphilus]|uniref:YcjF family protein n=1 Tax=Desulfobulbus alkaliphilus TaxID=869814 RepID=UPI0019668DEC|nr:GTPase [Desulfobulbus alkaliphilus]MBM9538492.1 50S ribosome-binding GTPase [Desulfobulbus alkaliphilus]